MSERRYGDLCWCPVLAMAAEMDRLMNTTGVRRNRYSSHQADALLIGVLRDKHGCPGIRHAQCWWLGQLGYGGADAVADGAGVPEVRPRPRDLPGEYL